MSVRLRLLLALGATLLPAAGLAAWTASTARAVTSVTPSLPLQVGAWQVTHETRLDDEVLAMIQPVAHVMRLYEAPDRAPIWLYLGMYVGRAGYAGAHDPNVCYPAQGFEVLETRSARVAIDADEGFDVKLLLAHKEHVTESVLYWFQPAGRWPSSGALEQLLRMADAVSGKPQYAFVRLSTGATGDEALDDLREFSRALAPAIRDQLERLL